MEDYAAALNEHRDGWVTAMNMHFVRATRDEVVMEWEVAAVHRQVFGIVHGGVYAGAVETVCSVGAALAAMAHGKTAVGLENSTSFVHAVANGRLRATAKPLTRGRTTQVWECQVTDDKGRVAATGRVRLLCVEPGQPIGQTAANAFAVKA